MFNLQIKKMAENMHYSFKNFIPTINKVGIFFQDEQNVDKLIQISKYELQ